MKYNIIILLTVIFLSMIGCGDTPVFTEMSTNRLKVVIKGTLETEGASNFEEMSNYELDVHNTDFQDDSVDDVLSGSHDKIPTNFMFDIAELRLEDKKFANYRKIIEASLTDDDPFFNGTGVILKNDDPGEGNYDTVKVYIRKMIFNNAQIYESDGNTMSYDEPAEVIFHENDVEGFDFNQLQVNSYWDSLREEGDETLRNFPLRVPIIGGLDYNNDNEETVLEIRLVIKNFVKKYEYDYYDKGVFKVCHYYALSDWLRDVRPGENDIGRNIHAVARAYVTGKTGSIDVSATSGNYVIAIPASEDINHYAMANTGITIRNNNNCDLPIAPSYPGEYIEAVLDYYLKYEKYKYDFNDQLSTCPDFATYESEWETYEGTVENYKIPPYVALVVSGIATFTEIAPGTYQFYEVNIPATYGSLILQSSFVPAVWPPIKISGNNVTISVGTNSSI